MGEDSTGAVSPMRVVLADDQLQARKGLGALLSTFPGVEVIGEAADGQEAVSLIGRCRPDLVVMDARMPRVDGLKATSLLKRRWPEVRVLMLTLHASLAAEAKEAGADGFLLKGCSVIELLEKIRAIAAIVHRDDTEAKERTEPERE